MRRVIPAVILVSLGCAPPQMTPEQKAEKCGEAPTQAQAEAAVADWVQRGGLKDPFSAQTRDITVMSMGGIQNGILRGGDWRYGWIISFEVNAKNSYGGYVGWRQRYLIWNGGRFWWPIPMGDTEPPPPRPL